MNVIIVGVGVIGRAVSRRCSSAGISPILYDVQPVPGGLTDWADVCQRVRGHGAPPFVLVCVPGAAVPGVIPLIQQLPPGSCIIESTMAPWTSRSLLQPLADASWECGVCPERENPGGETPRWRVLGMVASVAGGYETAFYERLGYRVYRPGGPREVEIAEWSKVYENAHRTVCIGLAQALALQCSFAPPEGFPVNPHAVVRAAGTKGDSSGSYRPSAGMGGPCIPSTAYLMGDVEMVRLSEEADEHRRYQIAGEALHIAGVPPRPIVLLGTGYKVGVAQATNAPATRIAAAIVRLSPGAKVTLWDHRAPAPLPEEYVAVVCTARISEEKTRQVLNHATGWIDPTGQDSDRSF